jgi:hypothetical protein
MNDAEQQSKWWHMGSDHSWGLAANRVRHEITVAERKVTRHMNAGASPVDAAVGILEGLANHFEQMAKAQAADTYKGE